MSGICGLVHFGGGAFPPPEAQRSALHRMAEAAPYRGPHGLRCWTDGPASLAYQALHIAREDGREEQPLVEGGLALVADARLDNRAALIRALDARRGRVGEQRQPTDARLILLAYRRWGTACAAHLLGDFAFTVWDARRQRVFAARDPMAMRPLYYRHDGGRRRLLFASEVKQILALPGVPRRLFEPAIAAHLAGRFEHLAWTFYEGVAQLPPAHALVADADGCRTWRYWDINPSKRIRYRSETEYAEHFRELFEEATRCRLRSAAPVGVLLSGGIDSTCVAATAGHLMERGEGGACPALPTYSWGFDTLAQCDERAVSDPIVRRYGLPSTTIDAEAAAPLERYPADAPDADEPFAGAYDALLRRALDAARADGARQVLTGHRGDLVVGEWIFDYLGLLRSGRGLTLWRELQAHTRRTGMTLGATVRRYLLGPIRQALWPRGRAAWLRRPARHAYRTLRPAPSPWPAWLRPAFAERAGLSAAPAPAPAPPGLRGHARRERYRAALMPRHMRVAARFERCCARAGLAHADPWSDRRLVEFAVAAPPRALSRAGDNKRLARVAMRGVMPEATRQRAGKTSPKPLYDRALKERAEDTVRALITDTRAGARGYLDEEALRAYYERYRRGDTEDPRFWYALTLEMWLRQHALA